MERESLVASKRPVRGREMVTTDVPGKNLGFMRVLTQKKLEKPKLRSKDDTELLETVKQLPSPPPESDGAYHEIYLPNQKFLVPDRTLEEMEKIVNAGIRARKSFRFKNETSSDYPDKVEILPDKLDDILEKIEDMDILSEESVTSSVSSTGNKETQVSPIPSLTASPITSIEDIEPIFDPPLNLPFKLMNFDDPDLTKFYEITHQLSDEMKDKRVHFRILGNHIDLPSPKFKVQKFKDDAIYELLPKKYDQTYETGVYKFNTNHKGRKANLSISGKLIKNPSEGFLNIFHDMAKGEQVDGFSLLHKIRSSTNTASECALALTGKFMCNLENQNQKIIPVLSLQVNKKGAIVGKGIKTLPHNASNKRSRFASTEIRERRKTTESLRKNRASRLSNLIPDIEEKKKKKKFLFFPVENMEPNLNEIQNQQDKIRTNF